MIINKVLGGGGLSSQPPFRATIKTFPTAFVPKGLNYTSGNWLFCGNDANGKIVVGQEDGSNLKSVATATATSVTGVAYTSSGYLILSTDVLTYPGVYAQVALSSISSSTSLNTISSFSSGVVPSCYAYDIVTYQNQCYILGRGYPRSGQIMSAYGANWFSSAVPTFDGTYSANWDNNGGYPIRACLQGSKALAINGVGCIRVKGTVGAQYVGTGSLVAGTTTGITTSRVAYFNDYMIVGGSKADGTYIWYASGELTENKVFAEKKIDGVVGTVIGIAYTANRYVVAYTYQGQLYFWASAYGDISRDAYIAYSLPALDSISTDTFVDMKGNGSDTYLLSYSSSNVARATLLN